MRLSFPATAQLLIPFFCAFALFGCKKDETKTAAPTAAFTFTIQNNVPPAVVNFTSTSTGAKSYIWDFGDNTPSSSLQSPTHTYAVKGTYTVTLDAVNDAGRSTVKQQVMVGAKSVTIVNATLDSADQYSGIKFSYKLLFYNNAGEATDSTAAKDLVSSGSYTSPAAVWSGLNKLVSLSSTAQNNIRVRLFYQIPLFDPNSFFADTNGILDINLDGLTSANQYPSTVTLYSNSSGSGGTKITLDLLWQ